MISLNLILILADNAIKIKLLITLVLRNYILHLQPETIPVNRLIVGSLTLFARTQLY